MKLITILIAALALSSAASAQSTQRGAVVRACMSDVQRLCGGLHGRELKQCLTAHRAGLSVACKTALAAAGVKPKEIKIEG